MNYAPTDIRNLEPTSCSREYAERTADRLNAEDQDWQYVALEATNGGHVVLVLDEMGAYLGSL